MGSSCNLGSHGVANNDSRTTNGLGHFEWTLHPFKASTRVHKGALQFVIRSTS